MEIEKAVVIRDSLQKRRLKDSPYLTRADLFYRLSVAANKEDTQALAEYASFLEYVREYGVFFVGLLFVCKSENRYDKAEQHYLQALTINPNDTNCLRKYAAFLQGWDKGKKEESLSCRIADVRQNIDLAERFFARSRGQVEEASVASSTMTSSSETAATRGNDNNSPGPSTSSRSSLSSSGSNLGIVGRTRGRSRSEDATGVEQQEIRLLLLFLFICSAQCGVLGRGLSRTKISETTRL